MAAISLTFAISSVATARAQDSSAAATAATGEAKIAIAGNYPAEAADFAAGPEIASTQALRLEVVLALHNRAALDQLIAAQQDRTSPQYHQWLSPAEFSARFGPTQSDLAAVSTWLSSQGFTVESQNLPLRKIVFSGPAANAESAFGVTIHTDSTQKLFTNLSDPIVPKSIAPMVASIRGLSNLAHAQPAVQVSPDFATSPNTKIKKLGTHFGPNDLYTFYDETPPTSSSNNGAGTDCIALLEDSDFDDASVNAFTSEFGLSPVSTVRILPDGSDPGENGDIIETLLDVEYSHAAAPGVTIYAYIGNNSASANGSGVLDAGIRAVSDDICGAISISFSYCGEPSSFYTGEIDPIAAQAAVQGQAVFASSGDFGAAGYVLSKQGNACVAGTSRNVSELSADPNITAVGGTQFTPHYKKGVDVGNTRESIWKDKLGSGGGGESGVFAKPSYQSGIIPTDSNRDVPDVSLVASPLHPGFFLGYRGEIACCIGGTSLSAPYWAGITQLAAQKAGVSRIGPLNPILYSISSFRDVTKGINTFHHVTGFKATVGYDRSSGLGTPDIDNLTSAIAAH